MPVNKTTPTLPRRVARLAAGLGIGAALLSSLAASAMELAVIGNTVILSGPVTGSEPAMVKAALAANPKIDMVVLRNSHGGNATAGYAVGELLREAGVTTAVSGYCISSCSRMFLGGKQRLFTDDYPIHRTYVGFHGHYDAQGNLDRESVARHGLYDWIIRYSDGKADPALVKRWIAIQKNRGSANFFHPHLEIPLERSAYFCDGQRVQKPISCERLDTDAMKLGVITQTLRIHSPDYDTLPDRLRALQFPASGYAELEDIRKLPLDAAEGREAYESYLQAPLPRAFAVAPGRRQWGWNSAGNDDVVAKALKRCEERARQACVLYSVDEDVVYK